MIAAQSENAFSCACVYLLACACVFVLIAYLLCKSVASASARQTGEKVLYVQRGCCTWVSLLKACASAHSLVVGHYFVSFLFSSPVSKIWFLSLPPPLSLPPSFTSFYSDNSPPTPLFSSEEETTQHSLRLPASLDLDLVSSLTARSLELLSYCWWTHLPH